MAKQNEVYKCADCGDIISVVIEGKAAGFECCGKPMVKQTENTVDAAKEKHVPVIEKVEGGYKVKIGSVPHPMLAEHYIQFIELVCVECNKVQRKYLKPGEAPEAEFKTNSKHIIAREYCNLHGLWTAKN